jgi:hypothetical protein
MFLYGSNKFSNLFVLQLFKIFSILLLLQLYFKCKESLYFFFLLLFFQPLHTTLIHFLYSSPKIFCSFFRSTHYTSWRILLMSLLYIFRPTNEIIFCLIFQVSSLPFSLLTMQLFIISSSTCFVCYVELTTSLHQHACQPLSFPSVISYPWYYWLRG